MFAEIREAAVVELVEGEAGLFGVLAFQEGLGAGGLGFLRGRENDVGPGVYLRPGEGGGGRVLERAEGGRARVR